MAADAYRQVTYLNDTTYENTQVLMEYATNGSFGNTTTAYSFGVQRESFVETAGGMGAGATMGGMTYQSSGTYYYTGTGSVANVAGSATNVSYCYTTDGIMTAYAMGVSAGSGTSTLTTNPTAYGTYGVYGYNGEYTHTNLGLQYLRARYLNVATGTFTSRDTYAGRMQDILSQNRYTYAENNPVGHSDPSGHAMKSGMGAALSKISSTLKTKISTATVNAKKAVQMAAVKVDLPVTNSLNSYVQIQKNAINNLENTLNKSVSINMYPVAGETLQIISFRESVATRVEKIACSAYDYCKNKEQEIITERMEKGAKLFGKGVLEAFAGATFTVTGLIYPASFIPGAFELTAAVSDISQGVQELEYGWNGDATSESVNFLQDTIFLGEEVIYETTTNIVGNLGLFLFGGAGGAYKVTPVQNASSLRSSAVPVTLGGKAATQTVGTTALTVQLTTQQPAQVTTPIINNQQNLVEISCEEPNDGLNWDAVVSKKGETRQEHVALHESNDLNKPSHGVFYGNSVSTINKAWANRANGYMISEGNTDIYIIPYQNAGYAGGYEGQRNNLNYITIITQKGTNNIITGFPGNGYKYTSEGLIGGE